MTSFRTIAWRALLGLSVMVAPIAPGLAAPPPPAQPHEEPIALSAIHALIAKAAAGAEIEFPEGDQQTIEEALNRLLARLDEITKPPPTKAPAAKPAAGKAPPARPAPRTLPVRFAQVRDAEVVERAELIQKAKVCFVAKQGKLVQSTRSILLVSGDAEVQQSANCIIIAGGQVKLRQSSNCVVVAGRSVEMSQCPAGAIEPIPVEGDDPPPAPIGLVIVAGERLKCQQSHGVIAHVLRPARARGGAKAIGSSQCEDILYLNTAVDWASSQDTRCRAVRLKVPIAR